jgi:hypothetical protein
MPKNKSLLIILLAFLAFYSSSQTVVQVRDFETWSSLGARLKVGDRFKIGLHQSLRLYDNSSKIDQYFTHLSTSFDATKFLEFGVGMRFIRDRDKDDGIYSNRLRFQGDVTFKHDVKQFSFAYRARLQSRNELGFTKEEGDFLRNKFRFKINVKYNIKNWKFDPEFSSEIFRESGRYVVSSFEKIRFTLGTDYKIKKFGTLAAYYRIERELTGSYPMTTNIFGLKLTYEFKTRKND